MSDGGDDYQRNDDYQAPARGRSNSPGAGRGESNGYNGGSYNQNGGDTLMRSADGGADRSGEGGRGRGEDGAANTGSNLHVSSLSKSVDNRDLEDLFSSSGKVVKASIVLDPHTRESRGFAFVLMATPEEAAAAIADHNGKDVKGRAINVAHARRSRARTPTPGRYYGPPKAQGGFGQSGDRPYMPRSYDDRGRYDRDRRYDDRRDYGRSDDRGYGGGRGGYDDRAPRGDDRAPRGEYRDSRESRYDDRAPRRDDRDRYGGDNRGARY